MFVMVIINDDHHALDLQSQLVSFLLFHPVDELKCASIIVITTTSQWLAQLLPVAFADR